MFITSKQPSLTAPMLPTPSDPALIDNPFTPEIYANGLAGFANIGGLIAITLESGRCDHTRAQPVLERVVVGRLVLPVTTAQALVAALNNFFEQHGMSPSEAIAAGATFQ